jgi:hypothetical protein
MALGDYQKTTYVNYGPPGISAERLNNNENKTDELDKAVAALDTSVNTLVNDTANLKKVNVIFWLGGI